jgi:hypothetical protein
MTPSIAASRAPNGWRPARLVARGGPHMAPAGGVSGATRAPGHHTIALPPT